MFEFEMIRMLRELNMTSLLLRLTLAYILGGLIGLERERKQRPAVFRTTMLVCTGAALAMILSQYVTLMLNTQWNSAVVLTGTKTDVSRFGAQVINGVGFLGASTVIVINRNKTKGLPMAAGMWSSACMGLAIGAGLYEGAIAGFLVILFSVRILPHVENYIALSSRNLMLYLEFNTADEMTGIIQAIKTMNVKVTEADFDRGKMASGIYQPNAVFTLRLPKKMRYTELMTELSKLDYIHKLEIL
ncbi:MAG: MgtC/SapB family protein [Brotaphodocola sp.]